MLADIYRFLGGTTPHAWVEAALQQQDILLLDHKNCEQKAAMQLRNAGGGRAV